MPATRRRFLFATGLAAAAGSAAWALRRPIETVSRTAWALGAPVTLTVLTPRRKQAELALEEAFQELWRVEQLLSIYRPDSQVSRLNESGRLSDPHPYLLTVLRAAVQLAQTSGGAFDMTVQPLWQLYAQAKARGELPSREQISAARRLVNWRGLTIAEGHVQLARAGMAITLNGIAQGFAADRVANVLGRHGIQQALIDTGEFVGVGGNARGEHWSIGIQHPRQPEQLLSVAQLSGRCLATSGDYATPFSDDLEHHHIFDPRTGRSPDELASVSVVAPSAMLADGLSTAVMVLGRQRGLALLEQIPRADGLLVLKDGTACATPGFPLAPPGNT